MNRFVVAFLALTVSYSAATLGIDTISAISTSGFQCLRSNNYAFYIGRVGATGRSTRPASNIKNAHSGGTLHELNSNVDAYLFPCHSSCCGSAKQQVSDSVNAFRNGGAKCGTLWLDVEIYNWGSNLATNQQFILDMVSQCKSMGVTVGIYTNNNNNWQNVVGIDWAGVSSYPIWWANYNGVANFNNFKPFGGWSKPAIHQYSGDVKGPCSVGNVDMNWYP